MTWNPALDILLVLTLSVAVITDIRSRKIFNWLTFPAIACGIILNTIYGGAHGLLSSFEGIGISSISLLLLLLGGMGAGDVKLLWAVGAMMGPRFAMWTLLYTAIAGGILGIAYAASKKELRHTILNAVVGGHVLAATRSPETLKGVVQTSRVGKMAYAPAIALGAAIAAYLIGTRMI